MPADVSEFEFGLSHVAQRENFPVLHRFLQTFLKEVHVEFFKDRCIHKNHLSLLCTTHTTVNTTNSGGEPVELSEFRVSMDFDLSTIPPATYGYGYDPNQAIPGQSWETVGIMTMKLREADSECETATVSFQMKVKRNLRAGDLISVFQGTFQPNYPLQPHLPEGPLIDLTRFHYRVRHPPTSGMHTIGHRDVIAQWLSRLVQMDFFDSKATVSARYVIVNTEFQSEFPGIMGWEYYYERILYDAHGNRLVYMRKSLIEKAIFDENDLLRMERCKYKAIPYSQEWRPAGFAGAPR